MRHSTRNTPDVRSRVEAAPRHPPKKTVSVRLSANCGIGFAGQWAILMSGILGSTSLLRADNPPPVRANRPTSLEPPATHPTKSAVADAPTTLARREPAQREIVSRGREITSAPSGPRAFEALWPLLPVLAVMAVAAWLAKRWLPRGSPLSTRGTIHVLARHHLSSKQSLCLVRLGRKVVFIGVTPDRITPLTEFTTAEEAAEITAAARQVSPGSFSSVFKRLADRASQPPEQNEEAANDLAAAKTLARAKAGVRGLLDRVQNLAKNTVPTK